MVNDCARRENAGPGMMIRNMRQLTVHRDDCSKYIEDDECS